MNWKSLRDTVLPWIALVIAVIGLGLQVYNPFQAVAARKLMFYSEPNKVIIVKNEQNPRLRVTYDNQPITSDVTLAQVNLWNAGTLPIKREHILRALTIATVPETRILESSVRAITRFDIINPRFDTTHISEGRLGITWNIFEDRDAIQLQVLLSGNPHTQLHVDGVVEGQSHIPELVIHDRDWILNLLTASLTFLLLLVAVNRLSHRYPTALKPRWAKPTLHVLGAISGVVTIAIASWAVISRVQEPRLMPKELMPLTVAQQYRAFSVVSAFTNK